MAKEFRSPGDISRTPSRSEDTPGAKMGLVWAKPTIIACVVEAAIMWLKAAVMIVARKSFID